MTKIEAGSDVDAYCAKCKLVLAHVVIAMKGSRPARVECKTCQAVHAYKREAPKKPVTRRSVKSALATHLQEYEGLMDGRDLSTAAKYKMTDTFGQEQVLDHKTFGLGLVVRVLSDSKIEVVFQTGQKVLAHAR